MGHRVLKRVPLDFDAPLNKTWVGYVNPYHGPLKCTACDQSGYNEATKKISDDWYSFDKSKWVWVDADFRYNDLAWSHHLEQDEVEALVRHGRLMHEGILKETHVVGDPSKKCSNYCFDKEKQTWFGWVDRERFEVVEPEYPTAEDVNKWSTQRGFGHDSLNQHICVEARAKRLGVYGYCPKCEGKGEIPYPDERTRKLHEEWEEYEPPAGDGYQLWETTSEGSPVSPVFESAEDLAEWCKDGASIFGSEKMSAADWLKMFRSEDKGDIGSLIVMDNGTGYFGPALNIPGADNE